MRDPVGRSPLGANTRGEERRNETWLPRSGAHSPTGANTRGEERRNETGVSHASDRLLNIFNGAAELCARDLDHDGVLSEDKQGRSENVRQTLRDVLSGLDGITPIQISDEEQLRNIQVGCAESCATFSEQGLGAPVSSAERLRNALFDALRSLHIPAASLTETMQDRTPLDMPATQVSYHGREQSVGASFIEFSKLANVRIPHHGPSCAEKFIEDTQSWWPTWLRWAKRRMIGHDETCAEDVLQEFLIGLCSALANDRLPKDGAALVAFCWTTMRNKAVEHIRKCRVDEHFGLEPPEEQWHYHPDFEEPKETSLETLCASAKLSEIEVQILRLWMDSYTGAEIAQEIGITPDNVRTRVSRIFAKLRRVCRKIPLEVPAE
jgi:RNA polymerase sigma factor (sigma-70 family)